VSRSSGSATRGNLARVSFVRVAFPVPLRQTFLYSVPDELIGVAVPGTAVRCPFSARERRGIVVERVETADRAGVKPITAVAGAMFAPDLLRLCLWIADYYLAPIGRVLQGALPGGLEGFEKSRARKGAKEGMDAVHDAAEPTRVTPTDAQAAATSAVNDALGAAAFAAFLLHGVTGSGKTEVYLDAAETCRRARRQTLVLVPEIALSHQLVRAFRARFGERVGVLHSSLAVGDRRATWERARTGRLDVVVGARSAVFAPLPSLGLVVVDEEHDPAYKQSEHIRYHGRDTAVVRARLANAVVVLGSATPSLESFANAQRGKYRALTLPERIDRRPMPVVEIVDLNEVKGERPAAPGTAPGAAPGGAPAKPPAKGGLFTPPLLDGLAAALARSDQALVFLNRRGHTRVVECEDCGFVALCPSCDVSLTYHSSDETFRCHYCGRRETATGACPRCESPFFRHKGSGTQKAEKELLRHFPQARVLRLDSDSASPRGAQAAILGAFARGEADVLLGTQMIAKGLDFHRVTFVGVVSADHSLHLPDFRAAERTFQQLVQVAGRAGRGTKAGKVVVQTRSPGHPALVCAARHDFAGFAQVELAVRNEFGYPPYGRLVALAFAGTEEERVVESAMRAVEAVGEARVAHEAAAKERGAVLEGALDLLGPAPSPLARLRGKHRWRITLKDRDLKRLHAVARAALESLEGGRGKLPAGVQLSVDVDPYDVL
jgi:primosomal protein N' (replication factor Y)